MPGPVREVARSAKRKRASTEERPSKRARSESSDDEEDTQAQILLLEGEIFESKKNYNNIVTLLKILQKDDEDTDDSVIAAISLCRVFTRLLASGDLVKKQGSTEKDAVVFRWLKERYDEYKSSVLGFLGQEGIGSAALTLCMRLVKTEGQYLRNGQEYNFPTTFLTEIIEALLNSESNGDLRKEFSEKYVEEYDDVRFFTFEAIA